MTGYVLRPIKIEMGCRSLLEPFTVRTFSTLLDERYADREFSQAPIAIPTVNPERTLLEKAFLLHEEFQYPKEKMRIERLSRHLYQTIVVNRQKFNKVVGVNFNLHVPQ